MTAWQGTLGVANQNYKNIVSLQIVAGKLTFL